MNKPVVSKVIDQATCSAAFQSRSRVIQYNPNAKASQERPKISKNLPNVNMAKKSPVKIMTASQISESAESLRRKRAPTANVTNKLSANQMAERNNKRVSMIYL